MIVIKGVAASPGIAIAKAYVLEDEEIVVNRVEIPRLDQDVKECLTELWDVQLAIRDAQKNNAWYRTVNKNIKFYQA